jgi:hypothetical protein
MGDLAPSVGFSDQPIDGIRYAWSVVNDLDGNVARFGIGMTGCQARVPGRQLLAFEIAATIYKFVREPFDLR